ncbi:MAG: NAD(P)-dependent oxidoreductase [candidate division Zixibacteria bacterium]|nr:NAD(P)-dependent oxidoreductase [candidate division Zixibacteria bacterium]NIW42497.1 NAD-binding protein [candidate division Zixibacteria bacterium]NIX55582.1 NAD-binding protein [candidate division Zixibacteria bacterium]
MTERNRIGFVGVGRMGGNMARRLKDKGYVLTAIRDKNTAEAESLAQELSCEAAPSPARVAELSDVVLTVVSDDAAMEEIYSEESPASLLCHAEGRLFINCATVSPEINIKTEARVEAKGGTQLEALMASSITQAREGTLYLICGGKKSAYEQAGSILQALSTKSFYTGPAGEATKVKALVNMVMNCNTAALAEGLGLGDALGLDLTMLQKVFGQTGAASRVLETDGEDMQIRDHECYFSAAHAAKDSGIALNMAQSAGLKLPLARATFDQYQRLVEAGKGELDKSGVAELTFKGRMK